jgi:hypothetical protein
MTEALGVTNPMHFAYPTGKTVSERRKSDVEDGPFAME